MYPAQSQTRNGDAEVGSRERGVEVELVDVAVEEEGRHAAAKHKQRRAFFLSKPTIEQRNERL